MFTFAASCGMHILSLSIIAQIDHDDAAFSEVIESLLPACTQLTSLSINPCEIGSKAGIVIAKMLAQCKSLIDVRLFEHNFDVDVAMAFAAVFPICKSMRIYLRGRFKEKCARHLKEAAAATRVTLICEHVDEDE